MNAQMSASSSLARRARWHWPEIVFWLMAFAAIAMPAGKHLILNEIAILALFALSLDLILGYAGIISLGHAAFFGLGAYAAGLFCKHVAPDPLLGLDPYFPLKFMVFFLIVVTVGGTSGLMGPFVASLLLGVADVAGKYYLSSALGGFVIYVVLIVVLVLRPHGLFARAR